MSVISSMATAISGLEANGQELGVISDNIVNANTTGFKASRGEFHNILAQDLNANATGGQIGRGVQLAGVTTLFNQGAVVRTEHATDLALQGNGFFVVKGDKGQTYTRDGSFRFDKQGWLTALNGEKVQAYSADDNGRITGKLTDIRIPYKTVPARQTGSVQLHINLDARQPVGSALDLEHPEETSHYTTTTQIFDSVGDAHPVSVHFNKTSEGTWEWYAMTDGSQLSGGTPGKPEAIAQGSLNFDSEGRLLTSDQSLLNTSFAGGAIPDQKIQFDFGDPIDKQGSGAKGTTQYGSKNATFRNVQDGFAAGTLSDTVIDDQGTVTGVYSNGQNKVVGQIALARFEANERLNKLGANQYAETVGSGQAILGRAGVNGFGGVMTKSLEQSNVDMAKEFVDMIKAQRGFQASAKSITSANEMLDEVIKLARA